MSATPSSPSTLELNTRELALSHLGKRFRTIRSLVQWLQSQGQTWPLLERLSLPPIKIGLRTVDQLQQLAPRLVRLDLTMVLRHCDDMLPFRCHALREICFPSGSKMTDASLCETLSGCPQLRLLELPMCNYISNVSIEHAMAVCRQLNRMKVNQCTWVDSRTLQYLGAARQRVSETPLQQWACSIGTKKRRIRDAMEDPAFSPPAAAPFTWLDATQCRTICDATLQQLFPSLRALSLCGCTIISDVGVSNIVAHCPSLRLLDVSWSQITDDGLVALLSGCRQLQFLGCAHCDALTDEGLRRVRPSAAGHAELHQLSLRSCSGLGAGAMTEVAAHWPMLRLLDVGGVEGVCSSLFAAQGWSETRCQQFQRTHAPSSHKAPETCKTESRSKRSCAEMISALAAW